MSTKGSKSGSQVRLVSTRVPARPKHPRPKTRYEETADWERDGFKRVKVLPDGRRLEPTNERRAALPKKVLQTPTRAELVAKYGPVKGRILLPSPNALKTHVEVELFWDQDPATPDEDPEEEAARSNHHSWLIGWRAPVASGDLRISETVRRAMCMPGNVMEGLVVAPGPWRGRKFRVAITSSAHPLDKRRAHSGESYAHVLEILDEVEKDLAPYEERRALKRAVPKTHGVATATTI